MCVNVCMCCEFCYGDVEQFEARCDASWLWFDGMIMMYLDCDPNVRSEDIVSCVVGPSGWFLCQVLLLCILSEEFYWQDYISWLHASEGVLYVLCLLDSSWSERECWNAALRTIHSYAYARSSVPDKVPQ